ncbi:hypothetical protein [Microbulbifer discodermiae]|uniref:hypothetical protein n=1 Tax=Microbulbifer sp. 2201CG32-9 TaxID=3232309 RepID=UPI00345C5718
MPGLDVIQKSLFTTVQLESLVPADQPLRPIKALLNEAMKDLNGTYSFMFEPNRIYMAEILSPLTGEAGKNKK